MVRHRLGIIGHFFGFFLSLAATAYLVISQVASAAVDLAVSVIDWRAPHANAHLDVVRLEREMRSSTIELTALGERFKAFIQRRRQHAEAVADGYLPEAIIVGTA